VGVFWLKGVETRRGSEEILYPMKLEKRVWSYVVIRLYAENNVTGVLLLTMLTDGGVGTSFCRLL